jgi:hypothetical protein
MVSEEVERVGGRGRGREREREEGEGEGEGERKGEGEGEGEGRRKREYTLFLAFSLGWRYLEGIEVLTKGSHPSVKASVTQRKRGSQ